MTGPQGIDGNGSRRKGLELEKYKRRMIRSVARRIREKKADEEVWEDMKKEIGSNFKKLWERMRILTLKKLKRLLEADDRVNLIGPVARMTLTDWLLFDLVIVHEKIDVIDRDKLTGSYQSKVLMNLFSLVQRFEIEGRTGENLAEAWTAATVYYNSRGHQCSPMMLQRRWYQLKELTRHKFYKFWFNYRGNQRQLITAKLDSPDELQKAIALKYPQVITEKFLTWEERIENRMVILPDELSVKMRQKNLMKASDTTAPDVVLVEPHIEVIDLGVNSDSEDEGEGELQNVSETQKEPIVKIKREPVDAEEDFEEQHEVYIPPEKGSELNEEIQRLQMVEENFDDNAVMKAGPENVESVVIDPVPPVNDHEAENTRSEGVNETEQKENVLCTVNMNEISSFSIVDGEITNVQRTEEAIIIDDDDDDECSPHENATEAKDKETEAVISNDSVKVLEHSHIEETVDSQVRTTNNIHDVENDSNVAIAEISSIASAGVKVENVNDVLESARTDNMDDEQITGDIPGELLPVISTISSAGIKVETKLAVCNDITDASDILVDNDVLMSNDKDVEGNIVNQVNNISEVLPVISTVSSEAMKVEIETEVDENPQIDNPPNEREDKSPEVTIVPYVDINEPTDSLLVEKDLPSTEVDEIEAFGEIHADLNFADDGIDFADDGIAYVEEDEDDIITIRDLQAPFHSTDSEKLKKEDVGDAQKNLEDNSSDEDATEKVNSQKFDLKLLMCPVVYTTKLDVMPVFDDTLQYEQVYDKETIDKIYTLSKPVSKQAITGSEQVIEQEEGSNSSVVNDEQVEVKNDTINVSDDDLFRNETIEDSHGSDSESDVVDDSKRVKLSSYMLRKPQHRSYNPVILCKNPDFNTRLKKLSVGFFMSARNRTLLQSCIPMTIDMTKAFEDKLINGTLYLKPTPTDSVINIQDDVEVTSAALVQPTAVQQSLMSIDDTLESELKKRMAERIRAINLPDISQVRRLNQHLLTAEVPPLRLENEGSQDHATKIGPENYIQNIKNDIENLLSQQKAKDVSNTVIKPVIPEIESSPPPLVNIKSPLSIVQPTPPPMVIINSPTPGLVPAQPPPQIVSNNTVPSINTTNIEDSNRGTAKVRKQMRRTYYPPLAWNQRPHYQNQANQEFHKDALLTIDTLYKMLSALDPCSKFDEYIPKKKAHLLKKKPVDTLRKNLETSNEDNTNKDTVIEITDDEIVPVKKPRPKPKFSPSIRTKDKKYCCWYSYRAEFLQGNICKSNPKRRHRCRVNECVCCCQELYIKTDRTLISNKAIIAIEQEQQTEKHIHQTIEHVVQHINEPNIEADFSVQIDSDENDSQIEPLPDSLSPYNAVLTQTTNTAVEDTSLKINSSDDGAAELTPLNSSNGQQPTPKIRVYTGVNRSHSVRNSNADLIAESNTRPTVDFKTYTKKELSKVTPPILNIRPANIAPRTHVKASKPNQRNSCTCRPNISQVNKGRIEINGSNNCKLHSKQIKESKLLVKKLITDENQPFFVGKGKILLTNMKIPRKNNESSQEPIPPMRQPEEVQQIRLPAGVQIVLLPDQTLTYVMEPNVTLTPEEYAILPEFLVAIQQQINSVGITLPADHPVAKTGDIIDLDKDEVPSNPENCTVADTESAPISTEPIGPISPELNNETTSGEPTTLKTNEDFEVEIDSLAKEKRVTHDDFEMRIDILSIEKKNAEKLVTATGENIKEIKKPENPVSKINESESNNVGNSTENPVPNEDDNINSNAPITSSAEESINKKSLLSDLMEMSGIMEEDLAPPPLNIITPPEPIIVDTSNFVLQRRVAQRTVAVPSQSPVTPKQHYTATNKIGNFELTAVTSFADLKYSSDNNGLFFKLDLDTGQLTSINVCIQKYSNSAHLDAEKSVIDLTDDPEIRITGTTEDGAKSPAPSVNEKSPPIKTPISTIMQKKQRLMERLSNNLKPVNIAQSKKHVAKILRRNKTIIRKPVYFSKLKDTIEAKIDLVDSDAPMEEEYLVSDDSSDDEPLIKKSKRIHSEETSSSSTKPDKTMDKQSEEPPLKEHEPLDQAQSNVQQNLADREQSNEQNNPDEHLNGQDLDEQDPDRDSCSQGDDFIDEEEQMDDLNHTISKPVPTNLVLSGGALKAHNIPLNKPYRREEDNENSDEDCILGV